MFKAKEKEFMVFIPGISAWENIDTWPDLVKVNSVDKYWKTIQKTHMQLIHHIKQYTVTGVYFGNEFCEHLIPEMSDVAECIEKCRTRKLSFTFVTPPVSDWGISRLVKIFEELSRIDRYTEIVFNDWGVCKMLFDRYPGFTRIMGRTLDKMIREPRLCDEEIQGTFSDKGLEFIREPACLSISSRKFLKSMDVDRVALATKTLISDFKFQWPKSTGDVRDITSRQLEWLLDGLVIDQKKVLPVTVDASRFQY